MNLEVPLCPIGAVIGVRTKIFSFKAVGENPERTTERFDKHSAYCIQMAAAEHSLHQHIFTNSPTRARNTPSVAGWRVAYNRFTASSYDILAANSHVTTQLLACHNLPLKM